MENVIADHFNFTYFDQKLYPTKSENWRNIECLWYGTPGIPCSSPQIWSRETFKQCFSKKIKLDPKEKLCYCRQKCNFEI